MGNNKRKKRRQQNNLLVLKLLIMVAIVLVVFEGKLIYTMFTHHSDSAVVTASSAGSKDTVLSETETERTDTSSANTPSASASGSSSIDIPLAGLSVAADGSKPAEEPQTEAQPLISETIDSPAVVKKQETPVDDSFFADSVFIGDSRMMGFRNSSGITQGTFLTSVGLNTSSMSDQVIASSEGNISVYQGLSGRQYDKIYLMLGTNDLGYYPWEEFKPNFSNIVQQFHKLQPEATIYVCSVIYVDESKTSTSYNNNDNVRKINEYQLEVCEEESYCYYLNLNEIFTNGYGSLLEDASSDGIHFYETYCRQMLTYLKSYYVPEDTVPSSEDSAHEDSAQTERSETETNV